MSFTIKKLAFLIVSALLLSSWIINNPAPENCEVREITIVSIYEGGVKGIVFEAESDKIYDIHRGLEQGYTLAGMEEKVLHKNVTLHLAKINTGTSNHMAQLALSDEINFTEFN